jgi:NurA-like 5'-3' nuclease
MNELMLLSQELVHYYKSEFVIKSNPKSERGRGRNENNPNNICTYECIKRKK